VSLLEEDEEDEERGRARETAREGGAGWWWGVRVSGRRVCVCGGGEGGPLGGS
jgi:hypothetical protein